MSCLSRANMRGVRRHILQLASITLLLVTVGSHISELVDYWDHTLQTGNDIESVLIVLALTVGAVLALAAPIAVSAAAVRVSIATSLIVGTRAETMPLTIASHSPPPLSLRI